MSKLRGAVTLLLIAGMVSCAGILYKKRDTVKQQVVRLWYYHLARTELVVQLHPVFKIVKPTANPRITQQSVAYRNGEVFVVFPSDRGTNVGVVQVYNLGGVILREFSDIETRHASSACFANNYLYVLGSKKAQTVQDVTEIDPATGAFIKKLYKMPEERVWDAMGSYRDTLFFIGLKGTGYTFREKLSQFSVPEDLMLVAIYGDSIVRTETHEFRPSYYYETSQGLAVSESGRMTLLSSSTSQKKKTRRDFIVQPLKRGG